MEKHPWLKFPLRLAVGNARATTPHFNRASSCLSVPCSGNMIHSPILTFRFLVVWLFSLAVQQPREAMNFISVVGQ